MHADKEGEEDGVELDNHVEDDGGHEGDDDEAVLGGADRGPATCKFLYDGLNHHIASHGAFVVFSGGTDEQILQRQLRFRQGRFERGFESAYLI